MVESHEEADPTSEQAMNVVHADVNGHKQEHGTTNGSVPNGATPQDDAEELAVTVVDDSLPPSTVGSPAMAAGSSPPSTPDGLRRASSKIANLRAAFEKQNGGLTSPSLEVIKRRYERSPARTVSGEDAESNRLKEQYETEYANLKKQHEKELAESKRVLQQERDARQSLEQKCTRLENLIEAQKEGSSSQDKNAVMAAELVQKHSELEQKVIDLSKERDNLSKNGIAAQEEANNAQKQLAELKRSISSATRIEAQESDAVFAEQMQSLYHETQNWVVANFRKVKVDCPASEMCARLESIAEPKQLDMLRPVFQAWSPSIKLAAFQSTVVCYLMEIFDDSLLFGLPGQEDSRMHLKKASDALLEILPPTTYNKWRSTTLEAIRQSIGSSEPVEDAAGSMSEMICITLSTLSESEESQSRCASLSIIIKRAITLAHLFKVQRAQYEFMLPAPASQFLTASMEDTADGATSELFVRCGTFPAVIKLGDEHGDNIDLTNVISKAKVLCNG